VTGLVSVVLLFVSCFRKDKCLPAKILILKTHLHIYNSFTSAKSKINESNNTKLQFPTKVYTVHCTIKFTVYLYRGFLSMHLGPHTCNSLSQIEYIAACTCDTPVHPVPMKINTHMSHTLVVCMNTYERMNTYI